ncbi:transmembrane protein 132B-like isoform X2 [Branchiostoma floridae x Branchiostoma belcheri]
MEAVYRSALLAAFLGLITTGAARSIAEEALQEEVFPVPVSFPAHLTYEHADSAYFLQDDFSSLFSNGSETVRIDQFALLRPREPAVVRASYGPFKVQQSVPHEFLFPGLNRTSPGQFYKLDIRAHVLDKSLTPEKSRLGVLFHIVESDLSRNEGSGPLPCIVLHVTMDGKEAKATCQPDGPERLCIAETELPLHWWKDSATEKNPMQQGKWQDKEVQVFYSLLPLDESLQCPEENLNSIRQERLRGEIPELRHVGAVFLTIPAVQYKEVGDSSNVMLKIPKKVLTPGQQFSIPVLLSGNSTLQTFDIRAKPKNGIQVLGARPLDPTRWQITSSSNQKHGSMTVTASMDPQRAEAERQWQQQIAMQREIPPRPIFEWDLLAGNVSSLEHGGPRINWRIEYEVKDMQREVFTPNQKIVTHLEIREDSEESSEEERPILVPIAKHTQLLNTAVLNGLHVSTPLRVLAVMRSGKVIDISDKATCTSPGTDVIKVMHDCSMVYLDGTEMRGSQHATIIVSYADVFTELNFTVWMPELPLTVELSDTRLSQIKGWKVALASDNNYNRQSRSAAAKLNFDPRQLLREEVSPDSATEGKARAACRLRYQHATVQVFTRFYTPENDLAGENRFLLGDRYLQITELVSSFIRVADESIASLKGTTVNAKVPGTTEIQVISPLNGRLMGAQELMVADDKVTIKGVKAIVVAGITMSLSAEPSSGGKIFSATTTAQQTMTGQYQRGVLDVSVSFSDGSAFWLREIEDNEYSIKVSSLNPRVVALSPSKTHTIPRVIATGHGKGDLLEVELRIPEGCMRRKRGSELAFTRTEINVNLTSSIPKLESSNPPTEEDEVNAENRPNDIKKTKPELTVDSNILRVEFGEEKEDPSDGEYVYEETEDMLPTSTEEEVQNDMIIDTIQDRRKEENIIIPLDNLDFGNLPGSSKKAVDETVSVESEESYQDYVEQPRKLSDLEIGMYALLGVFCLAIMVFLVNCILFAARYKQKRIPNGSDESLTHAHDWVWLGKAGEGPAPASNTVSTQGSEEPSQTGSVENVNEEETEEALPTPPIIAADENENKETETPEEDTMPAVNFTTFAAPKDPIRITSNPCPPAEDEFDWDYRQMGLKPDDDMTEYLENLKESSA